ncbi:MAG: NINE protein, partial [Myxococcota bacterium]
MSVQLSSQSGVGSLDMESKSTGVSYILLALSVFGFAGLHRFYLGRPVSGLLYLLTWGFFGVGTFVDIFTLPRLVEEENMRLGFRSLPPGF